VSKERITSGVRPAGRELLNRTKKRGEQNAESVNEKKKGENEKKRSGGRGEKKTVVNRSVPDAIGGEKKNEGLNEETGGNTGGLNKVINLQGKKKESQENSSPLRNTEKEVFGLAPEKGRLGGGRTQPKTAGQRPVSH